MKFNSAVITALIFNHVATATHADVDADKSNEKSNSLLRRKTQIDQAQIDELLFLDHANIRRNPNCSPDDPCGGTFLLA